MSINTIIPIFMFSFMALLGVVGLIVTISNRNYIDGFLEKEKVLGVFSNLNIKNSETFKVGLWNGRIKVYEKFIFIENSSFHLFLVKEGVCLDNKTGTITIKEFGFDVKESLYIKGIKHRLLGNSDINVTIKSNNKNDLKRINQLIINEKN